MKDKQKIRRWAWVLTGSGHFFNESIRLINYLTNIDLFVSKAAEEVLIMYKKKGDIPKKINIYKDNTASSVPVGQFYRGIYHTLIMAPTSSNTVAKCVFGISDNLATNVFAQSGKCRVPCIYFPCDSAPELKTRSPKGMVDVFPRKIDLDNVEKLKKFEKTKVVLSFKELKKEILIREKCLKESYS
ncbi:MAG: flavoprotein [Rickettsiales bacterium]|nr:flavoprotein [Rickettsiales bacterium]